MSLCQIGKNMDNNKAVVLIDEAIKVLDDVRARILDPNSDVGKMPEGMQMALVMGYLLNLGGYDGED